MVDQVAIFFLAGHETSASALAWTLYLMALSPEWQDKVAAEAQVLENCDFAVMSKPENQPRCVPRGVAALPARADDGARGNLSGDAFGTAMCQKARK